MPPAVPLSKFLAPQKSSWADDDGGDAAPPPLPSYASPSYASPQHAPAPAPSYGASKPIPTTGPFVIFVGNVPYELQQVHRRRSHAGARSRFPDAASGELTPRAAIAFTV